jgi:hypothetical protein
MGAQQLKDYLRECLDVPFKLGQHDCIIFANTCWHRYFGYGWADQWLKVYMHQGKPVSPSMLKAKMGFRTFESAISSIMARNTSVFPSRGSLVAVKTDAVYVGCSIGIAIDHRAAFVGTEGLQYLPINDVDYAWHPRLLIGVQK